jgi:predicted nucleotidyltransferase
VNSNVDIQSYLQRIANMFNVVLKDKLVGIYLHGSLAMGCFNSNKSDIDLLVLSKNKLTTGEKKEIAKQVLLFHDELPSGNGIELSIVLESFVEDFVYPTPFEFHFSDFHRERYKADENYICEGLEDPDLAAHITVTYHRGITIHGRSIRTVFKPIESKYYVRSILSDIEGASQDIVDSPVYFTLNLCRVLFFLREGVVSSKKEGGEWGLKVLPHTFHQVISQCLDEYAGLRKKLDLENEQLVGFSNFMLEQIKQSIDSII